jgi:hypothetical protein
MCHESGRLSVSHRLRHLNKSWARNGLSVCVPWNWSQGAAHAAGRAGERRCRVLSVGHVAQGAAHASGVAVKHRRHVLSGTLPAAGLKCGKVLPIVPVRQRGGPKVAGTLRVPSAKGWKSGNASHQRPATMRSDSLPRFVLGRRFGGRHSESACY